MRPLVGWGLFVLGIAAIPLVRDAGTALYERRAERVDNRLFFHETDSISPGEEDYFCRKLHTTKPDSYSDRDSDRRRLISRLRKLESPAATDCLASILTDPSLPAEEKGDAAEALQRTESRLIQKHHLDALTEFLRVYRHDSGIWGNAIYGAIGTLGTHQYDSAVPVLIDILKENYKEIDAHAATALAHMNVRTATQALLDRADALQQTDRWRLDVNNALVSAGKTGMLDYVSDRIIDMMLDERGDCHKKAVAFYSILKHGSARARDRVFAIRNSPYGGCSPAIADRIEFWEEYER